MRIRFSKPAGKVPLKDRERTGMTIEKKLLSEPIPLKKKPPSADIASLRGESWISPGYPVLHSAYH